MKKLTNGIKFKNRDLTDVFNTVYASKSNKYFSEFIKLCCTFITLFNSHSHFLYGYIKLNVKKQL